MANGTIDASLAELKAGFAELKNSLVTEIANGKADNASVKADNASVKVEISGRETRIVKYIAGGFAVHATLTLTAIGIAAGVAIAILK